MGKAFALQSDLLNEKVAERFQVLLAVEVVPDVHARRMPDPVQLPSHLADRGTRTILSIPERANKEQLVHKVIQ